jgi:hypothetical protein
MLNNNIIICSIVLLIVLISLQNNQTIQLNLAETDTSVKILYAVLICGIIYTILQNGKLIPNSGIVNQNQKEGMNNVVPPSSIMDSLNTQGNMDSVVESVVEETPEEHVPIEKHVIQEVSGPNDITSGEVLTEFNSENYLPRDPPDPDGSNMGHFSVNTDVLDEQYLDATATIGTMSSTLRNANYDLRCAPPIPRVQVGPWQQTTMEPDPYRKPLEGPECGGCSQSSNNE